MVKQLHCKSSGDEMLLGVKFKELLNALLIALKEGCPIEVNGADEKDWGQASNNCFVGDTPNKKRENIRKYQEVYSSTQGEKEKISLLLDFTDVKQSLKRQCFAEKTNLRYHI